MGKLWNFHYSVSTEDLQLEAVIEATKDAMGISEKNDKVFSSDILRLELSEPNQPHLTLVDLPGLFQAGSRSQSDEDAETIKALVLSHTKNPRSIILAVVSAKNDFNNQSITRHSREIDPKGRRTLGLITKADTLDKESYSDRFYLELAQNKEVKFRLDWHVLRNRDFTTKDSTTEERDQVEASFFEKGIWRSLSASQMGIHSLKPRLSKILKDHIVAQLPEVLVQIEDGIQECTARLNTLGTPRATVQEQRRYLLQVSQSFSNLVKAAVDGQYSDTFFGDASTTEGYQKHLRAVLQNTLTEFAVDMRKKGHTFTILDEGPTDLPHEISRTDYISKVTRLLERSRGRELPGTFDPLIIGHLFHEQRKPWAGLVDQYLDIVLHAVRFLARSVLAHVCDETSLAGISRRFIYVRLERLTAELRDKVAELLKPHDTGRPITYNHYLTESVQNAQRAHHVREIRKSLEGILGGDFTKGGVRYFQMDVNVMINALVSKTEADMNTYASSTATDFMQAYYGVAQKKIIDDFSVLAVEARIIQELPSLFTPADVIDIDDVTVAKLASESEESSRERTLFSEKLKVLEHGHKALQGVQDISPPQKDTEEIPSEYSIESDDEIGSSELEPEPEPESEPVEISSHHEEEPPYIIEETSGPDQVAIPDDQWDFSVPVSISKKKKKSTKKTHRPVEVLAE
ncbi:hypothetical protein AA0116_g13 [Alternaria tenuissima]|nr:hypothetical protein AA0116_g13 [Alternaria tenuissima]